MSGFSLMAVCHYAALDGEELLETGNLAAARRYLNWSGGEEQREQSCQLVAGAGSCLCSLRWG